MSDTLIVVGAAIVRDHRVLAAQRAAPEALRGRWEFPGGKVDGGESPAEALTRECKEELGVTVRPLRRVGTESPFLAARDGHTRPAVFQLWRAELVEGEPEALEHLSLRWVRGDEFADLDWLPVDVPFLEPLTTLLTAPGQPF